MPVISSTNSTVPVDPTRHTEPNLNWISYTLLAITAVTFVVIFACFIMKKCKGCIRNNTTRHTLREIVYNPPPVKVRRRNLLQDKIYKLHHKADLYKCKPPKPWRHESISLNNFSQQVLFESQVHLFQLYGNHIVITPVKNLENIYEETEELDSGCETDSDGSTRPLDLDSLTTEEIV